MTSKKKQFIFDTIDEYFEGFEDWAEQLQERLAQRHSWNQRACTIEPLRHMEITPLEVKITVDLPHTEEKNVKITQMNEKTIEISAKIKKSVKFDDFGITYRRGEFNMLQCRTRIPVPVNTDQMKTRFNKGILEIRLPRKSRKES